MKNKLSFLVMTLEVLFFITFIIFLVAPKNIDKPEILIIRETTESQYGQPVLILDYMVGGIATSAVFYHYQMDEYDRVMQYLHRIGRIRYASPMIEPMGGE